MHRNIQLPGPPNKSKPPSKYASLGKTIIPFNPELQETLEKISHSRAPSNSNKTQKQLAKAQRLAAKMLLTANTAMFNKDNNRMQQSFEDSIENMECFVVPFFGE